MTDPVPSKDLLTRLRTGYLCEVEGCRCHVIEARSGCQCAEAADEIERLRTALHGIQSCSTCSACRGAATLALGGEAPAARKPDKFDLAFEIMRQLEAEDMETMQSCQFGYVMRVTRERAAKPPGDGQ